MNDEIKLHPIISYTGVLKKDNKTNFHKIGISFTRIFLLSHLVPTGMTTTNFYFAFFFFLLYNYFQYGGKSGFSVSPKEQRGAYNTNR